MDDIAFFSESFGPMDDCSGGDASCMLADFIESPRSDTGVGPAVAGLVVGAAVAGKEAALEHGLVDDGERIAAVVAEEEDEGVVELIGFFEGCNESTDAFVHSFDHRGVGGHAEVFEILLFWSQTVPVGKVFGVRWQGKILWKEAEFFLSGEAGFANGLPSGEVLSAMTEDVFFGSLKWIMRCLKTEIEEEGLVGFLAHEIDGPAGEGVTRIIVRSEFSEGLAVEPVAF